MTHDANLDLDALLGHHDFVRRLARSLVHDEHRADDLTQDAMVAAVRHAQTSSRSVESARGWLATVVFRLAANFSRGERRRAARESIVELESFETTPERILEREALRREVVEAVLALEEPYRSTILLRYFDDRSPREIAGRMGVTVETVRSRLKRANLVLRERLAAATDSVRGRRALVFLAGKESAAVATWSISKVGIVAAVVIASVVGGWIVATAPNAPSPDPILIVDATTDPVDPEPEPLVAPNTIVAAPHSVVREPVEVATDATKDLRTWSGRIVDPEGKPIQGAEIRVVEKGPRVRGVTHEQTIDSTRTGADGRFEIQCAGRVRVADGWRYRHARALAPGFATVRLDLPTVPRGTLAPGDVELIPATTLRGVVLDQLGVPVADSSVVVGHGGDEVHVWWSAGPHERRSVSATRTDSSGQFVLEGVPIDWVFVYADVDQGVFFRTEPIAVQPRGATPTVEVRVRRLGETDRLVVFARDSAGSPIPGASLRHRSVREVTKGGFVGGMSDVLTDADGKFECFVLEEEEHEFDLLKHGTIVASSGPLRAGAKPVTLTERKFSNVLLVVTDEAGTTPAEVIVTLESDTVHGPHRTALERSERGWEFVAPKGAYRLDVKCAGYETPDLGTLNGASTPERIDVILKRSAGVRGVVRDAGGPIAGAWIRFERSVGPGARSDGLVVQYQPTVWGDASDYERNRPTHDAAVSDAEGRFVVHPAIAGSVILRADAKGYPPRTLGPIDVDPAGPDVEIDIDLLPAGAIEGRVVRSDGLSSEGLFVIACRGHNEVYDARVGIEGTYRLDGLPMGDYEVAVRTVRDLALEVSHGAEAPVRDIQAQVTPGETAHCDLELQVPVVRRLEGRFLLGGSPRFERMAQLTTRAQPLDFETSLFHLQRFATQGNFGQIESCSIRGSGEFAVETASDGPHRLAVWPRSMSNGYPGWYEFEIALDEPVTTVEIDLPVGVVEVRAPSSWRHLPNNAHVLWRGEGASFALIGDQSRENRVFRFIDVPAGRVRVEIGNFKTDVDVRAGETTTIDAK